MSKLEKNVPENARIFRVDGSTTLIVTGKTEGAETLAHQMRAGLESNGIVSRNLLGRTSPVTEITPASSTPSTPDTTPLDSTAGTAFVLDSERVLTTDGRTLSPSQAQPGLKK